MKQQRLFEIIYASMTHEACTVSELVRMLEVSSRTVRRDIEAIVHRWSCGFRIAITSIA